MHPINEYLNILLNTFFRGGKLYDYIRSYNHHSRPAALRKQLPIKFKAIPVKKLFKSSPIEIPETPISPLRSSDAKCNDDEDNTFSFYDLLQSYYEDESADKRLAVNPNRTNLIEQATENSYEEAPHFNLIANDLDVNNILNCSQKLLKSVSSTLKRVQTTEEPKLMCNDIIAKSIESLERSDDDKDDVYLNIIEPFDPKETILCDEFYENLKLFDVGQLPRAIIKRWFREIIFAVKHLHANDIMCYDLRPDNLLLGKNGEILLSYFYRRELDPYIFSHKIHETCYPITYIAPERPFTFQSDVWSIGVIFYELVTGYSFQSCHPDGILSYFDIQYPENFELDSNSKDLIEGVSRNLDNAF